MNRPKTPPSVRIMEAIAGLEDTDPADLEPGLDTVVDTEALDQMLRHDGQRLSLSFSYGTHHVLISETTIYIDGQVAMELD